MNLGARALPAKPRCTDIAHSAILQSMRALDTGEGASGGSANTSTGLLAVLVFSCLE